MNKQDQDWLCEVYENFILPGRRRGSKALHCDHWSKMVYLSIKAERNKRILCNGIHAACIIDGIIVDLEFNAYIKDWGWNSTPIDLKKAVMKPISDNWPIEIGEISNFYNISAKFGYKLKFADLHPTILAQK
jgi:hypothetical protein